MTTMTTQELKRTALEMTPDNDGNDTFNSSLWLWVASFPLLALGLWLAGSVHQSLGLFVVLLAAVCFCSPITLLLCCIQGK